MCNWTYLRFNPWGESNRKNIFPSPKTYVWGFDLHDHKVKLCYLEDDNSQLLVKVEAGRFDDDCQIVAWAPLEGERTEPDLDVIKRCGIYWPPRDSPEYLRKLIRVCSHTKPKSPWHKKQLDSMVADAKAGLASATA